MGLLVLALPAQGARSAAHRSMTIRLISTTGPVHHADRLPKGPSKGDVYSGSSILRNAVPQFGRATGAVVGRDYEVLTLTSATAGIVHVRVHLPGGTLRVQGKFDSKQSGGVLSVVSGTARFANALGTEFVRDLTRRTSINVFYLTLPSDIAL